MSEVILTHSKICPMPVGSLPVKRIAHWDPVPLQDQSLIESGVIVKISGQSYNGSTIVNYYSRVVPDLKVLHFTTLEP